MDNQTKPPTNHHHDELSQWDSWNPMAEDYESAKNTLALNPNQDPECVITGQVLPDSLKVGNITICQHYAKYGRCADGEYCDRAHMAPREREKIYALQRAYESNKNRTCLTFDYLSPNDLEINPNARLLVTVTNSKSPSNFYFVAPYEQMNFSNYTQDDIEFYIERVKQTSSTKTKLDKCHEQLAALFDHKYRVDNVNDDIYLSQIVACKLKNGRFHRAMVVETDDLYNDKFLYKLFLLDVGVEVALPRESIYDIKAHCLSEPPMAINCRLNVKPPNDAVGWSQGALKFFEEFVNSEKYWLCKIINYISQDMTYTVDLYHLQTRSSFTEKFIESKLAERCH